MCVIQYGEFVQVDVLVVDGVHEGVAVQHIAQFARACCFIHSGSVVAVGQHLGGIRQHFIGGVAVHQGRCSSLGRQSCLLCMRCVDGYDACGKAVGDCAGMYFSGQHTGSDAAFV